MEYTTHEPKQPTCHEVQEQLQAAQSGRAEHCQTMVTHILSCPDCRKVQRDLRRLSLWLGEIGHPTDEATLPPHHDVAQRAIAMSQQRRQRKRWQWATLATTSAALALCLVWTGQSSQSKDQPMARLGAHQMPPRIAQRDDENGHIKMIWPSDHVFVITKSPKKQRSPKHTKPKNI